MARKSQVVEDLAALVEKYLKTDASIKRAYKRKDSLIEKIALQVEPGQTIQLSKFRTAKLIDKFAERKVIWKSTNVRPYEIEVESSAP